MCKNVIHILSGHILEEENKLTLAELCKSCHTPAETIILMIDYGVISPCEGTNSRQWLFHREALLRTHKALRLKQDLGINMPGIALALELLDELDAMQKKLELERRLNSLD